MYICTCIHSKLCCVYKDEYAYVYIYVRRMYAHIYIHMSVTCTYIDKDMYVDLGRYKCMDRYRFT